MNKVHCLWTLVSVTGMIGLRPYCTVMFVASKLEHVTYVAYIAKYIDILMLSIENSLLGHLLISH